MNYYTGIGARKTPDGVIVQMKAIGQAMGLKGYTLRSGAAEGADQAFEWGCDSTRGLKHIYIPWPGFQKSTSVLYDISDRALEVAEEVYGPKWKYLKPATKKFMARNCYQVLGLNLDTPSQFIVCWTPDGAQSEEDRSKLTGGTGQAIALASRWDIPVFNLYHGVDDFLTYLAENVRND